ncbi:MAG TPA: hypothetical protein P5531_03785 [Bacteroidales bacterium]|nr:hypothetical protein [Bacteroidales bacterium]
MKERIFTGFYDRYDKKIHEGDLFSFRCDKFLGFGDTYEKHEGVVAKNTDGVWCLYFFDSDAFLPIYYFTRYGYVSGSCFDDTREYDYPDLIFLEKMWPESFLSKEKEHELYLNFMRSLEEINERTNKKLMDWYNSK